MVLQAHDAEHLVGHYHSAPFLGVSQEGVHQRLAGLVRHTQVVLDTVGFAQCRGKIPGVK